MTIRPAQFEVHPSSGVPIYLQIVKQVQAMMAGGHLRSGDMLPSVRQMATELSINPMTISKAYSKLESDGIVDRVRGKGMAIREIEATGTAKQRMQELKPLMEQSVVRGRQLGLTDEQIQAVVKTLLQEYQS